MRTLAVAIFLLIALRLVAAEDPHIVTNGAIDAIEFPGHLTRVLSDHHDTPGGTAVLELTLPGRTFAAPPHIHRHEDEHFYVLEGTVDFLDRGKVARASAGSLVVLPRGYLHGFWNDTDQPARLLLIISPGQFSDFFDEVVTEIRRNNADTPEAVGGLIVQAAAKRGVEIHFDKVPASAVHLLPE
ncbi:cupin domain-containing protein [Pontiella sp.]|uniref:cupin domain-containing protein n=1 Tax=Pontiella sp. TaxID=2837462 RepID=UPI00356B02ED